MYLVRYLFLLLGWMPALAFATAQEYTLDNGLKLVVIEDKRAPVVVSQIWYKVGSSYEQTGSTGLSHVLEHLMFKGTKKYPEGVLDREIAERGGVHNAGTDYDFTVYYQQIKASELGFCFDIEADRMKNLVFEPESFEKEKKVVIEERLWRTEDKPEKLARERFLATALPTSPYQHPVIGWRQDIENLTIEDAQKWYQTWYAPNNAILVVVGNVKADNVFLLAKEHFGHIPASDNMPPAKESHASVQMGKRQLDTHLPAKVPMLLVGYNVPTLHTTSENWEPYALEVLTGILGIGESSRFTKQLIRKDKIAAKISADYSPFYMHSTLLTFSGNPATGRSLKDLETSIEKEVARLQEELVEPAELERVKMNVIAEKIYNKDSMFYQGVEVGALEASGYSWKDADEYVEAIQKITPTQVQMVAKKYLIPEHLTVTHLIPSEADTQGA